MGAETQEL